MSPKPPNSLLDSTRMFTYYACRRVLRILPQTAPPHPPPPTDPHPPTPPPSIPPPQKNQNPCWSPFPGVFLLRRVGAIFCFAVEVGRVCLAEVRTGSLTCWCAFLWIALTEGAATAAKKETRADFLCCRGRACLAGSNWVALTEKPHQQKQTRVPIRAQVSLQLSQRN